MNENWMNQAYPKETSYSAPSISLNAYTAKTFGWMFAGLMTTFAVAVSGYMTGWITYVTYVPYWYFLLLIAEVATVAFLSARVRSMSVNTARGLFFLYSALNGVVFSLYFLMFDLASMVLVFGATALFFGVMAVMGRLMNLDFSRIRPFMTGGLIFLVVFWLLAMFINLSQFELIACTLGIFLFLGFTAYDTHKIKEFYAVYSQDEQMLNKASIISALELYLDFINLFVYLLQVLGKKD
ncbi:MAG TPA: Bax inhibitor-1/YccA family protein [Candidatus Cottocaccamicrobium excrementipullorum]|nr:Bax inhibitor-1/YccA family protein [Candidatus Cottocaccamicrobium excrementipullorum]